MTSSKGSIRLLPHIISLSVIILLASLVNAADDICWTHSNVSTPGGVPCDSTANVSACCLPGYVCYSNGLCGPGPTIEQAITPYFWLGCTDATFSSELCLPQCRNVLGWSGTTGITPCSQLGTNYYCCYGLDSCDCSNPAEVFSLSVPTVVTTIALDTAQATTSTSDPSSSPSTSTSLSPVLPSSSVLSSVLSLVLSSPTALSSTFSISSGPAVEASPFSSSISSTISTLSIHASDTPRSTSRREVAIEVGVGISVAALAVVMLLCVLFLRKRLQNQKLQLIKEGISFQEHIFGHKVELATDRRLAIQPWAELGADRQTNPHSTAELGVATSPRELPGHS